MISGTQVALALVLGYGLTVLCLLAATFGLASASPAFVAKEHRITAGYKRLQALVWLVCVTIGAFATCAVAQGKYRWIVPSVLAAAFIGMLWQNKWEAEQRGLAHQILMSLVAVLGVAAGFGLANHFFKI
jgi:hypothetical protein